LIEQAPAWIGISSIHLVTGSGTGTTGRRCKDSSIMINIIHLVQDRGPGSQLPAARFHWPGTGMDQDQHHLSGHSIRITAPSSKNSSNRYRHRSGSAAFTWSQDQGPGPQATDAKIHRIGAGIDHDQHHSPGTGSGTTGPICKNLLNRYWHGLGSASFTWSQHQDHSSQQQEFIERTPASIRISSIHLVTGSGTGTTGHGCKD